MIDYTTLRVIAPFFSPWTKGRVSVCISSRDRGSSISQIGRRNCRCSAAFDYDITVHLLRLSLSSDLRPQRGVEGAGSINFDACPEFQHANTSLQAASLEQSVRAFLREAVTNLETNSRR